MAVFVYLHCVIDLILY